jgi:HEAT repeat protein
MYVLKRRPPSPAPEAEGPVPAGESGLKAFLSPQAGVRYRAELTHYFQRQHLGGLHFDLTQVLVEPRFIRPSAPVLSLDDDDGGVVVETDLYRVLPLLHQYPALYSSFNLETISLRDLETGDPHIALVGVPGIGKSTVLCALGLYALEVITMDSFRLEDQQRFDEEDDDPKLDPQTRERRRKEREEVQRRAIEQLRIVQRRQDEAEETEKRDAALDFPQLLPLYAHLRDLDLRPESYGGQIDPAEPLIGAQTRYLGRSTAQLCPPLLYKALEEGRVLVLLDGFEDVLEAERAPYLEWLAAFKEGYGANFIVVTAPPVGYDGLANLGFATLALRPFNQVMTERLTRNWLAAWEKVGKAPAQAELNSLRVDVRNRTPLDLTLKIWATLQGDIYETGRRGYYERYVRYFMGDLPKAIEILREVCASTLDLGEPPNRERLLEIAYRHLGVVMGGEAKAKKDAPTPASAEKLLAQMAETRLVRLLPNGGLLPRESLIMAYLAGETLQSAPPERLAALGPNPNWYWALSFATAIVDLEPAVLERVKRQPDLLFENMFGVSAWTADCPTNLRWKTEILKRIGATILQPDQFNAVREHAVAALVTARDDTGGAPNIFRLAMRHASPHLRTLGCLGAGAIGAPEAVNDLSQMLFDSVQEVQLAAGLALGAIGTEPALRAMTEALLDGDRNLKQAVAEAFAAIPGEGHAILHDGIRHDSIEVRRACAFGLARIPSTWALVALYRAMLEDGEWYVRQAAETAFAHAREPRATGPRLYPEPSAYAWLKGWASKRGETVPEGTGGRQYLMRALQEAPPPIRAEAARALAKLGYVAAVKALYTSLTERDADLRSAAFDALGLLSDRLGKPLPGIA